MARCFNRNTKEYKKLLETHGDPVTVDLLINDWQNMTGTDQIPGTESIDRMLQGSDIMLSIRKSSLANSLLRNLANKQIISKYNDRWYVNVTIPGKTEGSSMYLSQNISRLKNYLRNQNLGNVVSLKRTRNTHQVIVNEDMFTKKDLLAERFDNDFTRIGDIVNHLSSMFPEVKIKYMTPGEAQKAYKELPSNAKRKVNFKDVKSFYYKGNAVLIKGRVTKETAVEEILHPFVNALYSGNNKLFSNLSNEAKKLFPELAQKIEASYSDKKGFYAKDRNLELVTQALSRHFNKEYENNPSKPWYTAVKDFIKWFSDIIKNVYKNYMGGTMRLNVGFISSETSMSDIAKMLNTTEFEFRLDLYETGDRKVQYALSEGVQKTVDTAKDQAVTDTQVEMIDRLLHQIEEVDDVFDAFGTTRVVLDKKSGEFEDLDAPEQVYNSLEEIVHQDKPTDNLAHIVEGVLNEDENLIDPDGNIRAVAARIDGMREDGSVILPGVILSDTGSQVATIATALRIRPDGAITVYDIKRTTDFTEVDQSIFINTQRRILENLGYDVTNESHTIVLEETGEYKKTILHLDSENEQAVEEIVPENIDQENRDIIGEILGIERNLEGNNPVEDLTEETQPEVLDNATYNAVFSTLKEFRKVLVNREQGIKTARNIVSMDISRREMIESIQMTRQMVEIMYEKPEKITKVYVDVIQDIRKQVKEFKKYATDPDNFGKPEFIAKVQTWMKYAESFRGLTTLDESGGLNKSEKDYRDLLIEDLNDLIGIRSSDKTVMKRGVFDIAIKDYVRTLVKSKSNRNFTAAQLEEVLTTARDINAVEYQTGDMATSRDTILALMDKIYKRDKQRVLTQIEERAPRIRAAGLKLARISGGNKVDYSFMLDFDDNNNFTGRYLEKIGRQYKGKLKEIRSKLYDDNGPRKFITIENKDDAAPGQLEHNKQLARDKKAFSEFMKAEIRTEQGVEDGEYHKYSDEFKEARAKHEVYIWNAFSDVGRWVKSNSVSVREYRAYLNKYYDILPEYERVINDRDGNPTGVTERVDGMPVLKRELVEIRDTTSKGVSMIDPRYAKLQDPKNELEKAQLEYYNMFIDIYEKELLEKLPENVKMTGRVPVIKAESTDKMRNKKSLINRMWTGMQRGLSNLIHPTTKVKKVFTDENGNIITNSLPLFFTGGIKEEQDFIDLNNNLESLEQKYKSAETQKEKDKVYKEIRIIRGKIRAIENSPTPATLSMDMTDSLLKFSAMAENYETMAAAEDTYLAMIKVLEDRTYSNSRGDIKVVDENDDMKDAVDPTGSEAKMVQRAKKWMKMVFYNNDQDVKTFWDKLTKGLISYTSLAYVGTNVFGNINNYAFGRISNTLETYGQRFYTRKAMAKAVVGFNKRMIPEFMISLGKVAQDNLITGKTFQDKDAKFKEEIPYSKYGAMVAFFRMLDSKADMRESGDVTDMWNRYTSWTYTLQDAGEFNVQSKVGMAVLHSTQAVNSETGATMSLYDALNFDRVSGTIKIKEGYDKIKMYNTEKLLDWNDDARYEIRNYIRETNKVTHGNYAYEDRMVMQSHSLGQLAAQFHKWVAPSIKARFRAEYFDENLGWMEGRYLTFWNFLGYAYKNIAEVQKLGASYKEFHGEKGQMKLQNVHRVMGEIAIIFGTYLIKQMLMSMWDMHPDDEDDDSDYFDPMYGDKSAEEVSPLTKRLRNILVYQMDRLHDETVMFVPIPGAGGLQQMGHFIQNPIASSRTLGEIGEAIEMTARTGITWSISSEEDFYANKNVVYQRGTRAGEWKLGKEWGDSTPFLLTINKWKNFIQQNDFYIK